MIRVKTTAAVPRSRTPAPRRGRRALEYGLVLLGVVVFVNALVGEKGLLETVKKQEEFRALELAIAQLRLDNARLREQAARLQSDPQTIEDLARRELGLIKPGEHLFIVKDVPPGTER